MRKTYTFILSFFIGILIVGAQVSAPPIIGDIGQPYPASIKNMNDKTVNCIDSVRYPQSKLTGIAETGSITYNASLYQGISQAYHLNTPATIHGIGAYLLLDFDGTPGNIAPVNAQIKVYNIDAQNYPTTQIDSAMVQIVDVGFNEQVLMFSSPIAVSDSFAITIEMDSTINVGTDTIFYTTNVCGWDGFTCAVGDGNMEGLSCLYSPDFVSANGSGWFHNYIEVFGWDIDYLMHPIIEQNFTSNYSVDTFNLCLGQPVTFTNTSVLNTVPMFNQFGSMPLYEWDMGDGTGTYNPFDTTYTYGAAGVYTSELKINYYGYDLNCVDSFSQIAITVFDTTVVSNFGFAGLGLGSYQFSDSSTAAFTYSWDFGDASALDNSQNPTHTYASGGSYEVCLTVTDTNGCNVNMYCDSVTFTVGIDDYYAADHVNIYPIPANKYFNVTVPNNYFGGEVIVTDIVGQRLKSVPIEYQEKVKVSTDGIASGVYFVSIDYNGERVFTKRIVINR